MSEMCCIRIAEYYATGCSFSPLILSLTMGDREMGSSTQTASQSI